MQATRDNRTIVLPPHIHCYISERDPMAEFNVRYAINVLHRTAHSMHSHAAVSQNYLYN